MIEADLEAEAELMAEDKKRQRVAAEKKAFASGTAHQRMNMDPAQKRLAHTNKSVARKKADAE